MSAKVEALLDLVLADWTKEDFAALCLAAADQCGMSAWDQKRLLVLLPVDPADCCPSCGSSSQPDCRCGQDEGDTVNNLGMSGLVTP